MTATKKTLVALITLLCVTLTLLKIVKATVIWYLKLVPVMTITKVKIKFMICVTMVAMLSSNWKVYLTSSITTTASRIR